ncbi:glycoside hydrolase family 6 protein [Natronosporangium hydrolyticum]|uniref:Glucanase n=1 Tax=Natronosporangium hydrolyticum TaxID=2811111 RepID=A0A895YIL8_9ACTN|nr:glycoside hydrolase family 6 protein [Natronosporangium hydrolyticum]QSB15213.1 glycoside hydrolase family 6 protein [Natronosporangium hydrolyticum]
MKFPLSSTGRRRAVALTSATALVAGGLIAGPAAPAQAQTNCTVDYNTAWDGGGGFGADITINNLGSAINGWNLTFNFPGDQQVTNGWTAVWSQSGSEVTASNESWNASIPADGSISIGFNGSYGSSNEAPTTFFLNGVECTGQPGNGDDDDDDDDNGNGDDPGNGGQEPGDPGDRVANPYVGADVYVNPDWSAAAQAGGAPAEVYNHPTGVWLDRIAAIESGSAGENTTGLEDHLDQALDQKSGDTPMVFQVVIYNLPGRDCAALASNGELGPEEIDRYKEEYIDVITDIIAQERFRDLRIVAVIEIDSLPNLVTNTGGEPGATEMCDTMLANGNYVEGVGYATGQLGSIDNVYPYIDAAHHGWIGWDSNFTPSANIICDSLNAGGAEPGHLAGLITNTANYSALEEPFIDTFGNAPDGQLIRQSDWVDWNDYNSERRFAQDFRQELVSVCDGVDSNIGMLIDTARNGWGGPDRPTAASSATELNQFVEESRVDRRIHKGNWCNQAGAGLGERLTVEPVSGIDAYVWIKPPGESDGSSEYIENDEGKGFDEMCDPAYEGNERNGNSMSGAIGDAPISGHWFQAQFQELMDNAYPPLGN